MFKSFVLFLLVLLTSGLSGPQGSSSESIGIRKPADTGMAVPRWQPHDFSFTGNIPAGANPFLVPFSATLQGPGATTFTLPGFYDGGTVWKIRASPTLPGKWTLITRSTCAALDGRIATFVCVPPTDSHSHGPLRVDPDHPRHFVHEDGARCYLQSAECDWLWSLELGRPASGVTGRFLDKLAHNGFNEVILSTVANDTKWKPGNTGSDDFGPPVIGAWEGTLSSPDHSRFNLAYWQHFDEVIAALDARGMQAHLLIKVNNKQVKWPAQGSAADDLYFRWLISRYSAFPNITWDLTKEGYTVKNLDYKLDCLRLVRATDPYHRLLTLHDDDPSTLAGAYDGLLDFLTDQQHDKCHSVVLEQHARRDWPVLNAESLYEWGPGGAADKTYPVASSPQDTVLAAWDIAMAGGYATHYYTYTAWDIIRPDDTPPGYALFRHLGTFFRDIPYWTLQSADELVGNNAWCLADPGREYVVFKSAAGTFTLQVQGARNPLYVQWYHPYTGEYADAGMVTNGSITFTPPSDWGNEPLVLHAGSRKGPVLLPPVFPLVSTRIAASR